MKKKIIAGLAMSFCFAAVMGIVSACGSHTHTFADQWATDATYHWHAATCEHKDEVSDKDEHAFTGNTCSVCGYEKQAPSPITEDTSYTVTTLFYGDTRLQLLSDSLVRIEDKANGTFEDRESYIVYNRNDWDDKVAYETKETDAGYEIVTDNYTVVIPEGSTAKGMYIADNSGETIFNFLGTTGSNVWLPSPSDELSSWYFTDSPRVIPSDYGYSPSDDDAPVQGWEFQEGVTDIYVFLPHGDYKTFTSNFVALTGQSEMITLNMFGSWDSRYYAYSEETALQQIKDYQSRGFSIDVLVVDTDWRSTSGGWGYDVNKNLFPDMERFLQKAHELGVNIVFNDHPQPVTGTDNLLDSDEVAYRNEKLSMLLAIGVDYWWYDRNWGVALNPISDDVSRYATGMYAYQWITQKYYESLVEEGSVEEYARRALIMANVDGNENGKYGYASDLSAHRYSIQWTGDVCTDPEWLQNEIEGAVMAGAELGLPYVSSDIGGHYGSAVTNAEYTRWYQYGALSNILRPHVTNTDSRGRMPWNFGETAVEVAHTYQDMRYRLLPLYYALAHENYENGLPIMRRLDIVYPQYVEAKDNSEYLLGDYILVAPIYDPSDSATREVFLPDGTWIDVWTGTRYSGPTTISVTHTLKTSPIFIREGALVALAENMSNVNEKDWRNMALDVYPSSNYTAKTTLYEDDTQTVAYKDGNYRTTDISMSCTGNTLKISIGAAQGKFSGAKAFTDRTWNVRLHTNLGWGAIASVKVNGQTVTLQEFAQLSYAQNGRPFAFTGGALDGAVKTFTITTDVTKAYEIEITYESVSDSDTNNQYDATAVDFKVTATESFGESVDLSALGTTDWVSYGWFGGTVIDYKADGPQLFSTTSPFINSSVLGDYGCRNAQNKLIDKFYSGGAQEMADEGYGCASICTGFRFTVKTTGSREKIVIYLGGVQTVGKLSVRDRAGNVKTLNLGGREKENFAYKIEIECGSSESSTLYFGYQAQNAKFQKQKGMAGSIDRISSRVELYCGYIAPMN